MSALYEPEVGSSPTTLSRRTVIGNISAFFLSSLVIVGLAAYGEYLSFIDKFKPAPPSKIKVTLVQEHPIASLSTDLKPGNPAPKEEPMDPFEQAVLPVPFRFRKNNGEFARRSNNLAQPKRPVRSFDQREQPHFKTLALLKH